MRSECCSFEKLAERVRKENRTLVMFGAGAIGSVVIPEILSDLGIFSNVECYIDNDKDKWETAVTVKGRSVEIHSPAYLERCSRDTIILLNISRYAEVYDQLSQMECTESMMCFITPMMLIYNYCSGESNGHFKTEDKPLIPKKLHYMWLGGKPLPDNLKKCRDSWERFCPDYEIIEWNEDNYDIAKHPYMKQAYECGAYGFVPDYARFDILFNEGGLYLDTDVEIIRSIDSLLYQSAFCGVEKWQVINFGGLSGSIKGHPMIKKFLDARNDIGFIGPDGKQNRNTCGYYDTQVAIGAGYRLDGTTQSVSGMNIYAYDYFHPYDYMSGMINRTAHTYSVHWFNGGWLDDKMKKANEDSKRKYMDLFEKCVHF